MIGIINKLLILDMLALIAGMVVLYVKPFGWDMTQGLCIISASFVVSVVLFLFKVEIWKRQKMTK